MKQFYHKIESIFQTFTSFVTFILGNSIIFLVVLIAVLIWIINGGIFFTQNRHESIRDIIHGLTFLSLFIIQKSYNHYTASIQLKMNELIASHEQANNAIINSENKTEHEINVLTKEYIELAELTECEK